MTDKFSKLFHGCIEVRKCDEGYFPVRFTKAQYDVYAGKPWCCYPNCTAGVYMEFITDAEEISFDYFFRLLFFPSVIFDIFENDIYTDFVREPDSSNKGHISYKKKTPGRTRIKIYLPYHGETHISNINFGNFTTTRETRAKRFLVYGDSISQGLMGTHPCMSWVPLVCNATDADYINLSVGGDLFDKDMIDENYPWKPTALMIALGTNDLYFNGRYSEIKTNIEEFFKKLRSVYPDIPVNVITPAWQTDLETFDTQEGCDKYKLYGQIYAKIIKEAEKAGCNAVEGLKIMPHVPEYFTDHVHPNDMGFLQYALGLLRYLKY